MRRFTMALAASLITFCSFAQGVEFEIEARYLHTFDQSENRSTDESLTVTQPINDSMAVESLWAFTRTNEYKYDSKPGFEVSGVVRIPISEIISVKVGLAVSYYSVHVARESEFLNSTYTAGDTIAYSALPGGGTGFGCDIYTNSSSDVGPVDLEHRYSILNLGVPVSIEASLLNDKLFIDAGVNFQTPVMANLEFNRLLLTSEDINGLTHCTFETDTQTESPAGNIRNAQLGFSANVGYNLTEQLGLVIGVRKMVTGTFSASDSALDRLPDEDPDFKPLSLSAGIRFRL